MHPSAHQLDELHHQCADLTDRLKLSETRLRERTQLLYELQQHYASEHFTLQESMRDLQTERHRNAGLRGQLATARERAQLLQARIHDLKARLVKYETVESEYFDTAPADQKSSAETQ